MTSLWKDGALLTGIPVMVSDAAMPTVPLMVGGRLVVHSLDWMRLRDPDGSLPDYAAAVARVRFDRLWARRHVDAGRTARVDWLDPEEEP